MVNDFNFFKYINGRKLINPEFFIGETKYSDLIDKQFDLTLRDKIEQEFGKIREIKRMKWVIDFKLTKFEANRFRDLLDIIHCYPEGDIEDFIRKNVQGEDFMSKLSKTETWKALERLLFDEDKKDGKREEIARLEGEADQLREEIDGEMDDELAMDLLKASLEELNAEKDELEKRYERIKIMWLISLEDGNLLIIFMFDGYLLAWILESDKYC